MPARRIETCKLAGIVLRANLTNVLNNTHQSPAGGSHDYLVP
ncbi:hypothetical protein [Bradyrhizobium cajani]|nr:hypothetical protein [Bradyrhizobium cajani]